MALIIPKGRVTDFSSIILVGFLWKLVSGIINPRLLSSIQSHDALRGFCARRGTGISALETNMLQQLIATNYMDLHAIFLNLRKAYNSLYRDRFLDILAGYGMGPRTICILWTHWVQLQMATKAGGH